MKDRIFFIFIILCLTAFTWVVDSKAPFCSIEQGTELLYQIDGEQPKKYYFLQTTEKVENIDSMSIIHYTGTILDKKQTVIIPSFSFTTPCIQKNVNTYLPNFIHIWKNETCQFTGPGFSIPASLSVGQHLEDGYMTIQQNSLLTRISQKNRIVRAQNRIKVPAGEFVCYEIESTLQTVSLGIMTRYKIFTWYAEGIGIIKSEIYRENKKLISRQLLLSIKK